MPRLCSEAKSYATEKMAIQRLTEALFTIGQTLDTTRWMIVIQPDGRFSPVVIPPAKELPLFMPLALHMNISLVS